MGLPACPPDEESDPLAHLLICTSSPFFICMHYGPSLFHTDGETRDQTALNTS